MDAVAIYLREIRKGRGLTQEALAESIGVAKRTIERLERNEGDIAFATVEQIVLVLRASADQLHYLATHADATIEKAKSMAIDWLSSPSSPKKAAAFVDEMHAEGKLAEVLEVIQQLEELDPAALDRLLSYGHGLLDRGRGP